MNEEVTLVILPSVYYRSGTLLTSPELLALPTEKEYFSPDSDLCHSIGVVPHLLILRGVDFADRAITSTLTEDQVHWRAIRELSTLWSPPRPNRLVGKQQNYHV